MPGQTKQVCHPRLGPVGYAHVVLLVADQPEQTLVGHTLGRPGG